MFLKIFWRTDEDGYLVVLDRIVKLKPGKVDPLKSNSLHLLFIHGKRFNHYAAILIPKKLATDHVKVLEGLISEYEKKMMAANK